MRSRRKLAQPVRLILELTGNANWRFDRRKSDPTSADTDWGGSKDGYEVLSRRTGPTRAS